MLPGGYIGRFSGWVNSHSTSHADSLLIRLAESAPAAGNPCRTTFVAAGRTGGAGAASSPGCGTIGVACVPAGRRRREARVRRTRPGAGPKRPRGERWESWQWSLSERRAGPCPWSDRRLPGPASAARNVLGGHGGEHDPHDAIARFEQLGLLADHELQIFPADGRIVAAGVEVADGRRLLSSHFDRLAQFLARDRRVMVQERLGVADLPPGGQVDRVLDSDSRFALGWVRP